MKIQGGLNLEFLLSEYDFNKKEKQGFVLEGGSGSGKTFDLIQFLLIYSQQNYNKNKDILIFRQTFADLRKTVLKDFEKILRMYDIFNDNDFHRSSPVHYKFMGNIIYFTGLDSMGSHGERHDVIWGNEGMELNFEAWKQLNQRCNESFFVDYNPSFTDHWIFRNIITRPDTKFFKSTLLDNSFLPEGQKQEILSYKPTAENIKNGTADDYMWKVYGLGERAAPKGAIFPHVNWIDEMPQGDYFYGLDFGFTCFEGNTLINTNIGDKAIKDIKKGDYILTRAGYKKVIKNHNNGRKKIIHKKIDFDFGYKEIICTFDHKFKTEKSWKQFKELQKGDKLFLNANLMEKHIGVIQKESTQTTFIQQKTKIKKYFTELFGKLLMEKFQSVNIFITLIKIRSITILKILCLLLIRSMQKYMNALKGLNQKKPTQKKTGIKEEKSLLKILQKKKENVNGVKKNMCQQILIKDFALKSAIMFGSTKALNAIINLFAKIAELLLKEINILNQKLVQINVHTSYREIIDIKTISEYEIDVYDLTIDEQHEYFANGILVHNCDPTALTKLCLQGNDLFIELMLYEPIDASNILVDALRNLGLKGNEIITADTSDKYNDSEMVKDLKNFHFNIKKTSKAKGILHSIGLLKKHKINIVYNVNAKREQENYKWREVNGMNVNEPVDKYNHMWDSIRYGYLGKINQSMQMIGW